MLLFLVLECDLPTAHPFSAFSALSLALPQGQSSG